MSQYDVWKLASPPEQNGQCTRCWHEKAAHEPTTYCQDEDCLQESIGRLAVCPRCGSTDVEVDAGLLQCMEVGCRCDQYTDEPPEPPDRYKERKEWEAAG